MLPIAIRSTLAWDAGAANSEASRIGSSFWPFMLGFPPWLRYAALRLFCASVAGRLRLPYRRLKRTSYLTPTVSESRRYPRVAWAATLACLALLHAAPAQAWPWEWEETKPALRLSLGL